MCRQALRGTFEGGGENLKIAEMVVEDVAELARLDKLCFSVPWSENSFFDEAQNPFAHYFVAKESGKIVGYGGIWLVADEGQITNIAVHPDMRKHGIATEILKRLIETAKNTERIVLEVRESNRAAICLYEKQGFKGCGIRKNFYHSPTENGIIMIRGEM